MRKLTTSKFTSDYDFMEIVSPSLSVDEWFLNENFSEKEYLRTVDIVHILQKEIPLDLSFRILFKWDDERLLFSTFMQGVDKDFISPNVISKEALFLLERHNLQRGSWPCFDAWFRK